MRQYLHLFGATALRQTSELAAGACNPTFALPPRARTVCPQVWHSAAANLPPAPPACRSAWFPARIQAFAAQPPSPAPSLGSLGPLPPASPASGSARPTRAQAFSAPPSPALSLHPASPASGSASLHASREWVGVPARHSVRTEAGVQIRTRWLAIDGEGPAHSGGSSVWDWVLGRKSGTEVPARRSVCLRLGSGLGFRRGTR